DGDTEEAAGDDGDLLPGADAPAGVLRQPRSQEGRFPRERKGRRPDAGAADLPGADHRPEAEGRGRRRGPLPEDGISDAGGVTPCVSSWAVRITGNPRSRWAVTTWHGDSLAPAGTSPSSRTHSPRSTHCAA